DELLRLLGVAMFFEVNDGNVRAFFGEADRHRSSDAAISAGNDGDLTLQFATTVLSASFDLRSRGHLVLAAWSLILVLWWLKFFLFRHAENHSILGCGS